MAIGRKEYDKFVKLKEDFSFDSADETFVEKRLVKLEKLFEEMSPLISEASAPRSLKELDALIKEDKRKVESKEEPKTILDIQKLIEAKFQEILKIRDALIIFKEKEVKQKAEIDTMDELIKSINENLQVFNKSLPDPIEENKLNKVSAIIAAEPAKIGSPKKSTVILPPKTSLLSAALKPQLLDVRQNIEHRLNQFEKVLDKISNFEASANAVKCSAYISGVMDSLRDAINSEPKKSDAELVNLRVQTDAILNGYENFTTLAQATMAALVKDKTQMKDMLVSQLNVVLNEGYNDIMKGQSALAYVKLYEKVQEFEQGIPRKAGWKTSDMNPAWQELKLVLTVQDKNYKQYAELTKDIDRRPSYD
ncbi:MAG: hypothetical protein ACYCQI_12960 [Gammaproteobacteria bacterium]